MKAVPFAFLGAVVLVLSVSPGRSADLQGHSHEDADHRYLLEVTVAQPAAVTGTSVGTRFCISPAKDERLEVCLGRFRGHRFHFGDTWKSTFSVTPEDDAICRCERPVVLTRGETVCWPMDAALRDIALGRGEIGGFVTVLEDVHEIGRAADSCIKVRSVLVPLTIDPEVGHDEAPVEPVTATHT